MFRDVQYVTDASGTERAVQIPIASWKKHMKEYEELKRKLKFFREVKQSIREVKQMQSGKLKKQTLLKTLKKTHQGKGIIRPKSLQEMFDKLGL